MRDAPAMRAPWMHRLADAAAADHGDRRARLDLRGVERGADAGGDAAADERELLGREIGLDLHQHRLVDGHLVGEGAEAARADDAAAVGAASPFGSIMWAPIVSHSCDWSRRQKKQLPHAGVNDEITRSPTATRDTSLPTASTVPAPSCPRMTGGGSGTLPVGEAQVGVADAAGVDVHEGVVRAHRRRGDLFDRPAARCTR